VIFCSKEKSPSLVVSEGIEFIHFVYPVSKSVSKSSVEGFGISAAAKAMTDGENQRKEKLKGQSATT
jgi:hypothetical protein